RGGGARARGGGGRGDGCAGDPVHPCDSTLDVLAPRPAATTLAAAVLDVGHDDYYAHAGSWWDVQDSAWLRHLDLPQYSVRVRVATAGHLLFPPHHPPLPSPAPS